MMARAWGILFRLARVLLLAGAVVGGAYGIYLYERRHSREAKLEAQVQELQQRKKHLEEFVARLLDSRRVAEIVVTEQVKKDDVIESTTLMFVEFARDGSRLPPRFFTIKGNVAHIDAFVIKFDRDFIEQNDPLRGHSIVLFHRLYGDYQAPVDGFMIDQPGQAPDVYRAGSTQSAAAQAFEAQLWKDFWRLADDAKFRKEKGVDVAQGEGPWRHFYPDYVYTITLQAAGGLNITSREMDGLFKEYRDALKRQKATG